MRIQVLRTFLVCAEMRSFSLAAQRLLYSESSVAYHVRELEKALGAQLFARVDGRLELTDAGRAILRPAISLLRTVDEMTWAVQHSDAERRGRLHAPGGRPTGPVTGVPQQRHTRMTLDRRGPCSPVGSREDG